MPGSAPIFISHSSHTATERAFLESLKSALEDDSPFRVLVDLDLYAGGDWNRELNEWMAECRAAVVLLTPGALPRPWVLKEVTTLVWRASLDDAFPVLPVWLDGVDEASVKASPLGPVFLERIQSIPGGDAQTVAAAIKDRLAGIAAVAADAATPLGRLIATLSDVLAGAPAGGLEEVTGLLGCELPRQPGARERYAELIARTLIREGFGQLQGLVDLINSLRTRSGFTADKAQTVLNMLAPMWIAAEDAGRLPALRERSEGAFAALNGEWLGYYTADMYLNRAYPLDRRWLRIPIEGAVADGPLADELAREIRNGFRSVSVGPLKTLDDDKVDRMLGEDRPRFVLVPPPHPDDEVLRRLKELYPRLTFILDIGAEPPEPDALPPWVERLPKVDLDMEDARFRDYVEALRIAEGGA
jgi:TIR domain-containing protein